MNSIIRKSVLGVAGLAFAGGLVGGPVAAVQAAPVTGPVSAVVVQESGADMGKLLPRGEPAGQS
ncbi:hypothetical protein E1091_19520, partial [Micromonospora fluostatini]